MSQPATLAGRARSVPVLTGIAVFVASMALYLATIAPTLTWGWDDLGVDGGEFLVAAKTLGVPHPPGYPTYTLALKGFATVFPVGDFAFRGNLFSALMAAGAAVLIYATALRLARHVKPDAPDGLAVAGAAIGAVSFAAAPLLWSQAVITEVYTLNALLAAMLVFISAQIVVGTSTDRGVAIRLAIFGLIFGLGLGNHLTVTAVAVPMLAWIALDVGWRRLATPWLIVPFLAGLSVYAYLPIRAAADPPINWGGADTLRGAAWLLTARAYSDYVFGVAGDTLVQRLVTWLELMFTQFNPLGLFFGLVGARPLLSQLPRFFYASLAIIVLISVYSVTFNSVDFQVLMVPALLTFSIWMGVGFFWILSTLRTVAEDRKEDDGLPRIPVSPERQAIALTVLAFVLVPGMSVVLNYSSQDLSDDRTAVEYARQVFDSVPDGSVVLSDREKNVFSLWYQGYIEEPERDVAVISTRLLQFDWYWDDVRRQFPDRLPATDTNVAEAVVNIVEHNEGNARVFTTFNPQLTSLPFDAAPSGNVFEVTLR